MIEMVFEERAFYIGDLEAVVIADLHIGYEDALRKEGISVPDATKKMIERIRKLITEKEAKRLIILGDVKHSIGECSKIKELEKLGVELDIVKGNHDGGIEEILDANIYPAWGFRIGDYGFIHGHSWPSEEVMSSKYVFMGHLHPEIELRDSVGKIHRYPCHLVGELTPEGKEKYKSNAKIFVLAAFNPLVGSSLADPLGPLMKNKIIDDFDVYLLNGTYLGKMEGIQP